MAYRPQANGTAERVVHTLTRALKMYATEVNQQDWDDYAEQLTFAINMNNSGVILRSISSTDGTRDRRWK